MNLPSKYTNISVAKGDALFAEGEPRKHLYVITSGQIAILKTLQDGTVVPVGIIGSGEFLGETGLMDGKATHATWAMALTDVEAIQIPSEAVEEQLKQVPQWLIAMTKGLAGKLRRMNDLVKRNKISDPDLDVVMRAILENDAKRKARA